MRPSLQKNARKFAASQFEFCCRQSNLKRAWIALQPSWLWMFFQECPREFRLLHGFPCAKRVFCREMKIASLFFPDFPRFQQRFLLRLKRAFMHDQCVAAKVRERPPNRGRRVFGEPALDLLSTAPLSQNVENRYNVWRGRHFHAGQVVLAVQPSFSKKEDKTIRALDEWRTPACFF